MFTVTNTLSSFIFFLFFFNDPATTDIYTLSLHDALPILKDSKPDTGEYILLTGIEIINGIKIPKKRDWYYNRSEEHTSELQSRLDLVCRLLLEKTKKKKKKMNIYYFSIYKVNSATVYLISYRSFQYNSNDRNDKD
mgnify:CR=1 FL=1